MRRRAIRDGVTPLLATGCAVLLCGCAQFQTPRIDPTGQRIFLDEQARTDSNFSEMPGPRPSAGASAVVLSPRETVAPVGSEVVLLAAVRGFDQYLRTNERVEWMLSPEGVGQFVQLDKGSWTNPFVGDFTRARKITNSLAVNSTSRRLLRLTRGTPEPEDDVQVLRGQAWITATSLYEGTSTVTALAPNVYGWPRRKQSATIHWIDAQWSFPTPAISAAGTRQVLTTTVSRHTDHSPRQGWLVRYNVVDGPAAGFAPDGSQTIEVRTNPSGQASVEIFQSQPAAGTNQISIQVIRPAAASGPDDRPQKRLAVGTGGVLQTWLAAELANRRSEPAPVVAVPKALETPRIDVRISGPSRANIGDKVTFGLVITNRGQVPAVGLIIKDTFGAGLEHREAKGTIERDLGRLAPGESSEEIGVEFLITQSGRLCHTVQISDAGGVRATAIACVEVAQPPPAETATPSRPESTEPYPPQPTEEPAVSPQPERPVSSQPDRQPPSYPAYPPPPERPVPSVPAIRSAPEEPLTPSQPGRPSQPATLEASPLTVSVTATPEVCRVGDSVDFAIYVTNTGQMPLDDVLVACRVDESFDLKHALATDGHRRTGDDTLELNLGTVAPGRLALPFDIRCRCLSESARACVRVSVTCRQQARAEDQLCLNILAADSPPSAGVSMTIDDLRDPVSQGKELTYLILLVNRGTVEDHDLSLQVTLPPEITIDRLGTFGPPGVSYQVAGQVVSFQPIDSIAAAEALEFRIRATARGTGKVVLEARFSSRNHPLPLVEAEKTLIFGEPPIAGPHATP